MFGFGLLTSQAVSARLKPSQKLAMIDSVSPTPDMADTLRDPGSQLSAINSQLSTDWKYEPPAEMPDPSVQGWWRGFNDPLLDSLIAVAVRNNYDVGMAARRIELGRLSLRQAQSAYYPTLNAQAGWTTDRTSAYMARRRTMDQRADYFSLGLQASWEIDVFGRVRQRSKALQAGLDVSRADYAAALVSLCAQLTESYIQLRVYQAQLEVAQRLSVSQQEVLRIANVRHECTLASGLDVAQAKAVCLGTQASVPSLQTAVAQTINAIVVLLGNPADSSQPSSDVPTGRGVSQLSALSFQLSRPKPIPLYSMPLDVEITPELLRRRPDVQAAEQQVAAYAAQIGVAKKDFLPALSLSAEVGTAAHSLGNLFRHDALTYTVQPMLSWTIFSGFSRKYAVAEAKEQMLLGIDEYNMTLTQAAAEVDNALVAYRNSLRRIGLLSEVLGESIKCFDFALEQYKQGLSPFLNVVNAQIDVLNYNNELVQERGNAQIAVMDLYKALGGGW